MTEIHGYGAHGIVPFMSDDFQKLMRRYKNIPTREGRIAFIMALGKKAHKAEVRDGVHAARGALKWIADVLKEDDKK